ncbi:MAG: hypothetical protein R3B13_19065 [Polyangiaceae bacterium]
MSRRAAVVFRTKQGLFGLPAEVVQRIATRPVVSPVPASGVGLAFLQGRVAATLLLGSGPHTLLCEHDSDAVALSGVLVEQVGFFDTVDGHLSWRGQSVPDLDVRAYLNGALGAVNSEAALP